MTPLLRASLMVGVASEFAIMAAVEEVEVVVAASRARDRACR